MGTVPWTVYVPTRQKENWTLPDGLDWKTVQMEVKRLQMRIAKAVKEKKYRRVRSLQWLLTHSYFAKLLAVRRVTSNKGKNTPGVDGVVWDSTRQKMNAVKSLHRHGYKAIPLRRVYIPKKSAPWYEPGTKSRSGITVIQYADDFIVTSKSREVLEQKVLPAIKEFLAQRGLTLSEKKTHITNINQGFDFLGQHVRKYQNGKVLTTPTRKSMQGLMAAARQILKVQKSYNIIRPMAGIPYT